MVQVVQQAYWGRFKGAGAIFYLNIQFFVWPYLFCCKVYTVFPQIEAQASISFTTFLTRPLNGGGL